MNIISSFSRILFIHIKFRFQTMMITMQTSNSSAMNYTLENVYFRDYHYPQKVAIYVSHILFVLFNKTKKKGHNLVVSHAPHLEYFLLIQYILVFLFHHLSTLVNIPAPIRRTATLTFSWSAIAARRNRFCNHFR